MAEGPRQFSGAWIRAQSDDELKRLYEESDITTMMFDYVRAELDRRGAERAANEQRIWIKRTFWSAVILGTAGFLATLLK